MGDWGNGQEPNQKNSLLGRRGFLTGGLAVAGLCFAPSAFGASLPSGDRQLSFYNTHTSEKIAATYWRNGGYDRGALKDIDYILRDFRTGDVAPIDRQLLDVLAELHRRCASRKPFQIISGYRSPKTNSILASASSGVAKRSLHMDAKAIDVRLADVMLRELRDTAIGMQAGGVGFYPRSDFVHVDTGRVRRW